MHRPWPFLREEAIKGAVHGASAGSLLWGRLPLDASNTVYDVLDDVVLRRLGFDEHTARWTVVTGLRGRAEKHRNLALQIDPGVVGKVRTSERCPPLRRDEPLCVVVRMLGKMLHVCGIEPIPETILAVCVPTRQPELWSDRGT